MLSRLISLLSRIPAVKWAFNRLRPSPQGGSIDVATIAAGDSHAIVVDTQEAAPADAVVAESPAAAPTDISVGDASPLQRQTEVEAYVVVEDVSVSPAPVAAEEQAPKLSVEAASVPAEIAEAVISSGPSPELPTGAEHAVAEEALVASADVDLVPAIILDLVENEYLPSGAVAGEQPTHSVADAEAISTDVAPTSLVETESAVADIANVVADDPSPGVAADVAPAAEQAPSPPIAGEVITTVSSESGVSPEPALVAVPAPSKPSRTPRTPTRAVDPADRATLIRQRWAQTGIRMWNPRLHGAGEATLNIQGRIELLPPEPGERMPRYDRLEFKMLGGQIVCEGVIVEGPVHAGQRSFTRLAEPAKTTREPMRERQAALA